MWCCVDVVCLRHVTTSDRPCWTFAAWRSVSVSTAKEEQFELKVKMIYPANATRFGDILRPHGGVAEDSSLQQYDVSWGRPFPDLHYHGQAVVLGPLRVYKSRVVSALEDL